MLSLNGNAIVAGATWRYEQLIALAGTAGATDEEIDLAATAAVNRRRKVKARRDAVPSWRDVQHVPVIVTSQRLLAATDAGWESAWWRSVAEFQPDLPEWSLTLGFGPGYSPMRLFGPATPALSIWAAAGVLGRQWSADPRLAALVG